MKTWWKSTRSNGSGACVEVGRDIGAATTDVRDTKDRNGGTLSEIGPEAWTAFIRDVVVRSR